MRNDCLRLASVSLRLRAPAGVVLPALLFFFKAPAGMELPARLFFRGLVICIYHSKYAPVFHIHIKGRELMRKYSHRVPSLIFKMLLISSLCRPTVFNK